MAKNNVEGYLDELRGFAGDAKGMDLYSLKKELLNLSDSDVFDNFEKESMIVEKDALEQIGDFSLLLKVRKLS